MLKTHSAWLSPIARFSRHVIVILLLQTAIITTNGAHYDAPRAIVSEYYGNPYYENLRALGVPRNSEIIVGENTSKGILKLLFECTADYPVQWIYTGDGVAEITTDTNVNRGQINSIAPGDFSAMLSIAKLTEAHTGNYTCRGQQDRNQLVSFFLFVPGDRIFTSMGGDNITFSDASRGRGDTTVRIPCSVSHPEAHVTLQKSKNGYLNCPLNDSLSFDPKTGFTMRVHDYHDPSGTYVCTGSFRNTFKLIQFQLLPRYEPFHAGSGPGFSSCYPSPCGASAECRILNRRATCSCISGYVGDPFVECRRSLVGSSGGVGVGGDPCHPSPCGRYGDCVIRHGLAACTCSPGFQGKPPHCTQNSNTNQQQSVRCQLSRDCPLKEPMCIDRVCANPCDPSRSRCGKNAECKLINRTPICSCPQGYMGNAYQECYLLEEPLPKNPQYPPYVELEERLRPECHIDDECPHTLACIHQKCQSPCPAVCGTHNRICQVQDHRAICNPTVLSNNNCHPADFNCNNNRLSVGGGSGPVLGTGLRPNHPAPRPQGGCHRISCGPHSECRDTAGEGVCSCLPGHTGTPPDCATICVGNSGCPTNKACQARKCLDPCSGHSCGINGKCIVIKHKAECQCLNGYYGDPKVRCNIVPGTLLQPTCPLHCGDGAKCQIINGNKPTCKCIDPFDRDCIRRVHIQGQGQEQRESPEPEPENCFNDQDCPHSKSCFNSQCKNPCEVFRDLCGSNQECKVINHKSECTCKPNFPLRVNNDCFKEVVSDDSNANNNNNNPINERSFDDGDGIRISINSNRRRTGDDEEENNCEPPFCRRGNTRNEKHRCRFSGDCSSQKLCVNSICVDMCAGGRACGVNAECRVVDRQVKCSCPVGFFGSPKIRCYPLYRALKDGGGGGGGGDDGENGGGQEIILLSNPDEASSEGGGEVGGEETESSSDSKLINSTSTTKSTVTMDMNEKVQLVFGAENSTTMSANKTITG